MVYETEARKSSPHGAMDNALVKLREGFWVTDNVKTISLYTD